MYQKMQYSKRSLGTLHKGFYSGHQILVKRIKYSKIGKFVLDQLLQEVIDIKRLQGSYILPLIGISLSDSQIDIITPYIPNGSLFSALHQLNSFFTHRDKLRIAREIAFAMKNLHYQRKVHGHLTSHNVLFGKNNKVLISDAGLDYFRKYAGLVLGYSNKSAWSSPEQLDDNTEVVTKLRPSDDSYSYGMIL